MTQGSRQCVGQSIIHLDDIFAFANQDELASPVAAPVRAYLDAPSRVEHDFSTGPAKVRCKSIVENSYKDKNVDVRMSFSQAIDSATGGLILVYFLTPFRCEQQRLLRVGRLFREETHPQIAKNCRCQE